MFVRLGPQSDFLNFDGLLRFTGFAFLFGSFVKELAEVHYPANRRVGVGRNLDQIKTSIGCDIQGFSQRNNAQVFVLVLWPRGNQTNLANSANLYINSIISGAD